jgi:hypothetical protein
MLVKRRLLGFSSFGRCKMWGSLEDVGLWGRRLREFVKYHQHPKIGNIIELLNLTYDYPAAKIYRCAHLIFKKRIELKKC